MTETEKKKAGLKTGKSYGFYDYQIKRIHQKALAWDISDSQYMEAMEAADEANTTTKKLLERWQKDAETQGITLRAIIESTTKPGAN